MKFFREIGVLWSVILCCAQGLVCDYKYTRQPPVTLKCNPYGNTNQLSLTCTIEGPISVRFSIIWLSRRSNGIEELKYFEQGVNIQVTSSIGSDVQVVTRSSQLILTELNETNNVGDYWCQVRLNNGSLFQEKSNILALSTESDYLSLSECTGSQSIQQENCLISLQIIVPTVTEGGTPSNTGSVVRTTVPFVDLSPTPQTTSGSIEEPENTKFNPLFILYVVIVVVVVFVILILVFCIAISIFMKYKHKNTTRDYEDNRQQGNPVEHRPLGVEATPVSQRDDEGFDFKENVAYNYDNVFRITLNENVSYVAAIPPTPAPPAEHLYEEIDDH